MKKVSHNAHTVS